MGADGKAGARARAAACLDEIGPLEKRRIETPLGGATRGWRTTAVEGLRFYHHRGANATAPAFACASPQGEVAEFIGYRPTVGGIRALFAAHAANRPLPRSPPGTSELLSPGRPS